MYMTLCLVLHFLVPSGTLTKKVRTKARSCLTKKKVNVTRPILKDKGLVYISFLVRLSFLLDWSRHYVQAYGLWT